MLCSEVVCVKCVRICVRVHIVNSSCVWGGCAPCVLECGVIRWVLREKIGVKKREREQENESEKEGMDKESTPPHISSQYVRAYVCGRGHV